MRTRGLVWFKVTASSATPDARVNRLSLLVPVKESQAKLYTHHMVMTRAPGPNWRGPLYAAPENFWDGGRTPREGWSGAFTPQLWVGSYERGLAFVAESPDFWSIDVDSDVMSFGPVKGGRVVMRIDFVQKPLDPGDGWTIEFGLMATPLKPPLRRIEPYRTFFTGSYNIEGTLNWSDTFTPDDIKESKLNEFAADGTKIVFVSNKWTDLLGFPHITDPEYGAFLHRFVDYSHRLGMKVVPYLSTLGMFVSTHPEFEEKSKEFLWDKTNFWRDPYNKESRIHRVVPTREWTDWYLAQLAALVREYKIDGVYLDAIAKPDVLLQKRGRVVYGNRLWRDFYERLYRIFHGDVIDDGYVFLHESGPNFFFYSGFADMRLSGEMQYFAAVTRHEVRPEMPHLRDRMSLDKHFVWTSTIPVGGVAAKWNWKSLTQETLSVGKNRKTFGYKIEDILNYDEMVALNGLFDMHLTVAPAFRSAGSPAAMDHAVWKLEDEIGRDRAVWFGYWDQDKYLRLSVSDDVAAAGFLDGGERLLLHVANLRDEARVVDVRPLAATGMEGKPLRILGQVGGEGSRATAEKGRVRATLSGNSFVRVLVEVGE